MSEVNYREICAQWLSALQTRDAGLYAELAAAAAHPEEVKDRFFGDLQFGTGGLRGILGAGTNRMNAYTVARATLGFARYIAATCPDAPSVVISFDSRHGSAVFSRIAAAVFAGQGIRVYIFSALTPTPVCSYAIRTLKAAGGVMITASHNPKQYNGYKAFGPDGCQISGEVADMVSARIGEITDYFSVDVPDLDALEKDGKIVRIPADWTTATPGIEQIYEGFLQSVAGVSLEPEPAADGQTPLKIVYTPLNGTGNVLVREILKRRGFTAVTVVPEQERPDGDFTTCPYPNPEVPEALALGLALCKKTGAELLIATDPDADRVGIAAVTKAGGYRLFTGNETAILLLEYIFSRRKAARTLPKTPVVIKTVVTAELCDDIAASYGGTTVNVLTGFKFIGDYLSGMVARGEGDRFILGFEESYGYMPGGYVRDKDAVGASMLIAEMTRDFARRGITLDVALESIYRTHGYYRSVLKNIAFLGADGLGNMNAAMQALRADPPTVLGGYRVSAFKDYGKGIDGLPASDVLAFFFEGGKVLCRPSGTEP
ncbi:MAG: phospho-sugar mutase, partial [Clostridiales bacterium]|nr:phospho-sugar mutase [Clostridiales bacterium]